MRIKSAHHSLSQPREGGRFVKQRTNGKHRVDTSSTITTPVGNLQRILRPQALFRWLGPQLAAITPTYIEQTMIGAMQGSTLQAWSIFDLMLKTWPELLACYTELIYGVLRKKMVYEPYHEEDEKPTDSAIEKQKLVACAIRSMTPETNRDDQAIEGTIKDVLDAWFRGVAVSEVLWQSVDDAQMGTIMAPKSTFSVDPTNYSWASDGSLGLRSDKQNPMITWPFSTTSLNPTPNQLQSFPEHKFLIAIHKASGGSPLGGALLRPLAWWWCAANFSSDWLLNLAQIFGIPFRWATYDPNAAPDTIAMLDAMLQNMGSNAWGRGPTGTEIEFISPPERGSDHSPQGELLDRADRYARSLILGQTMTGTHGTMGKGGGQAFGKVEHEVKDDRIDAAGKFATNILNQQLISSILMLNYGNNDEMPTMKFLEDEVADLTEAQRDQVLINAGLPIGVTYLRKKYDIPEPADGEEVVGGVSLDLGREQNVDDPIDQPLPSDPNAPPADDGAAKAGDAPGHDFHGNQWIEGDSIEQSGARSEQIVEDRRARYRHALSQLPEGTTIGKYKKTTIGTDVLWIHANGKSGTPNVLEEVGQKSVDKALTQHGIEIPKGHYIAASDQAGHPFRGNQYVTLGAHVNTPHGQGVVVATDDQSAWVSVNGQIRKVPKGDLSKIPTKPPFPSLLPSEENKRRILRNQGIQTKLLELSTIEDDAVFSRELLELTNEITP